MLNDELLAEVHHIYREANCCADLLAKHGHHQANVVEVFSTMPSFLSLPFNADLRGVKFPRIIAV